MRVFLNIILLSFLLCCYSDIEAQKSAWIKNYSSEESTNLRQLRLTSDKGFILSGESGATPHTFMMRTDSLGNPIWQTIGEEIESYLYSVYPNAN